MLNAVAKPWLPSIFLRVIRATKSVKLESPRFLLFLELRLFYRGSVLFSEVYCLSLFLWWRNIARTRTQCIHCLIMTILISPGSKIPF